MFRICLLAIFVHIGISHELDWWQTEVLYQIYPTSFKDSDGDGIGDLKGITEKAEYLADLGIGAVWLSPIYTSPMADMGYDISDYRNINPMFGSMEDFDALQKKFKELGMKLILDFVPNHTSDQHDWFQKSIKRIDPYTNYYVWRDPKIGADGKPMPPNNWISVFEGSAWEYVPERKQYYYHAFLKQQPDLNYRCEELVEEMKNTMKFWLDKGVNGFRVDAVFQLCENQTFADEPVISNEMINGMHAFLSLNHTYTKNIPETVDMVKDYRKLLDSYKEKDGETRVLIAEQCAAPIAHQMMYYGNSTQPGAHFPFNFYLIDTLNATTNAGGLQKIISLWLDNMPAGSTANWVISNHDNPRVTTRLSPDIADGMNMIIMLLPGVVTSYYGEELGMTDVKLRWDEIKDTYAIRIGGEEGMKRARDGSRSPFQWDTSIHAGFSKITGKTMISVNPNYWRVNLESQKAAAESHYKVYKMLVKLRTNNVIQHGDFKMYIISEWVFAFTRSLPENEIFVVIVNIGNEEEFINLNTSIPGLPETLNVHVASINSEFNQGDKLNTGEKGFKMRPKSGMVLQAALRKPSQPLEFFNSATIKQPSYVVLFLIVLKYIVNGN